MEKDVKKMVREEYGKIASKEDSCCAPTTSCGCGSEAQVFRISEKMGYTRDEMTSVPEGANLGLGCGNPVALASLKEGEVVLDLGSGAGFDCFLAAKRVGSSGKVIGVDMTPEMLEKAKKNAESDGYDNVEFRYGEIEKLPVDDGSVDAIISNCVINLSPEKEEVFKEAFRVLKPGGRIMVSDIVLLEELPDSVRRSIAAYVGCLAGAVLKEDYLGLMESAGFTEIRVMGETPFSVDFLSNEEVRKEVHDKLDITMEEAEDVADRVSSVKVHAVKPE